MLSKDSKGNVEVLKAKSDVASVVELAFSKLSLIGTGVGVTRTFTALSPPPVKEKHIILILLAGLPNPCKHKGIGIFMYYVG